MGKLISDNNNYYFQINIPNLSGDHNVRFISKPEISYNTDNVDNESIFFPSTLKIEFHSDIENLYDYLNDENISIDLYDIFNKIFQGKIDIEETDCDKIFNTYALKFTDRSKELKNKKYDEFSYFVGNENPVLLSVIIQNLTTSVGSIPIYSFPINYMDMRTLYSYNGEPFRGVFSQLGISKAKYFFDGTYETAFDILKSLLLSLGLIGYFYGDDFIIKSRFSPWIKTLEPSDVGNVEISFTEKYDKFTADVRVGETTRDQRYYIFQDNFWKPPLKPIEQKFELCGGETFSGGPSFNNVMVLVPYYVTGGSDEWVYGIGNSFRINGGSEKATWRAVADLTADRICKKRQKLKLNCYNYNIEPFDVVFYDNKYYIVSELNREVLSLKSEIKCLSI